MKFFVKTIVEFLSFLELLEGHFYTYTILLVAVENSIKLMLKLSVSFICSTIMLQIKEKRIGFLGHFIRM